MAGRVAREINERVIISGRLVLETPAHFGNGDIVGLTDMPLLRDPRDGLRPLLPGASIAGALRSYLREVERGFGEKGQMNDLSERLFGRIEGKSSFQSWVLVDDALGTAESAGLGIELRDGVALDPRTRTAEDKKKYDIELLAAGTEFPLHIEFLRSAKSADLLSAMATALDGLARGEIGLGQRKRRGFGRCRVEEWAVRRYELTTPSGLLGWLENDTAGEKREADIFSLLEVKPIVGDKRDWFSLEASFGLPGSLLIRSATGEPGSPDMVHLRSQRNGNSLPVVSGTSFAGAVRARALAIAITVLGEEDGRRFVDGMFGRRMNDDEVAAGTRRSAAKRPLPSGSRVVTEESVITGSRDLVQSRVKIDRFTGGAFPEALFNEQPAFGGDGANLVLRLALRKPKDAEFGLLLLVLKDLWTGDMPLGGESGVGRGRLAGANATLAWRRSGRTTTWTMAAGDQGRLQFGGDASPAELERCVAALWQESGGQNG